MLSSHVMCLCSGSQSDTMSCTYFFITFSLFLFFQQSVHTILMQCRYKWHISMKIGTTYSTYSNVECIDTHTFANLHIWNRFQSTPWIDLLQLPASSQVSMWGVLWLMVSTTEGSTEIRAWDVSVGQVGHVWWRLEIELRRESVNWEQFRVSY